MSAYCVKMLWDFINFHINEERVNDYADLCRSQRPEKPGRNKDSHPKGGPGCGAHGLCACGRCALRRPGRRTVPGHRVQRHRDAGDVRPGVCRHTPKDAARHGHGLCSGHAAVCAGRFRGTGEELYHQPADAGGCADGASGTAEGKKGTEQAGGPLLRQI